MHMQTGKGSGKAQARAQHCHFMFSLGRGSPARPPASLRDRGKYRVQQIASSGAPGQLHTCFVIRWALHLQQNNLVEAFTQDGSRNVQSHLQDKGISPAKSVCQMTQVM
jgi:hypothetical protein